MHIPAAIAQPEPLENDDCKHQAREFIGLQKALEVWGKEGCISGGNSTGTCYTLPHYNVIPKNNICPPSPIFGRSSQGLPRFQQLGCNTLLPPTWWYRPLSWRLSKPLTPCRCQCDMHTTLSYFAVTAALGSISHLAAGPCFCLQVTGDGVGTVDESQQLGKSSKPQKHAGQSHWNPRRGQVTAKPRSKTSLYLAWTTIPNSFPKLPPW